MLWLAVLLQDEEVAAPFGSFCSSSPSCRYITYHAGVTHFLFAHIVAEVLDALALVTIALGFRQKTATAPGPAARSPGM